MQKIRIKICDYGKNKVTSDHFIIGALSKYYEIELSENPDYLFYHEAAYDHLKYDCIKIFYTGENISPNFNLCDYAISFDHLTFEDRHYRLPLYLIKVFYNKDEIQLVGNDYLNKSDLFTKNELAHKTGFCSFVYSNYRAEEQRKIIFDKLSEYKKVDAGGGYLNNIGGRVNNKLEFEMKHKFSIAFENSSRSGYTTEKIVSSLVAKTIPIYWGNPNIGNEFNTKRFINCHDYASFDEVLVKVKELDNNDELYIKMLNEPIVAAGYNFDEVKNGFDLFLKNIIDQPLHLARRSTINPVRSAEMQKYETIVSKYVTGKAILHKIMALFYKPFKKLAFFEKLKYMYFRRKSN
ncbi:MAG: glycosyltransferase family 10 [Candidatus Paceibacterota bacterium]|jgi:hypothetical protein